ncbi:MAG TPA: acyltransferase family protein [Xanthomonadales bacterium]|nr:acyltransferase family protein [Xanthomonadales bacterium]
MHTQQQIHLSIPERLHGLDALRGFALLLGVVLHLSMSYLHGAEYFWIVSDGERRTLLGGLYYLIHRFRMPLFFLLAGALLNGKRLTRRNLATNPPVGASTGTESAA